MSNRFLVVGIVILLLVVAGTYIGIKGNQSNVTPYPPLTTSQPLVSPVPSSEAIFYPMSHYQERITNRWYGKAIVPSDNQALPCGAPFSGLHVGDDLEVTGDELGSDVPVYAIADGTVREVRTVTGYGGLLVIQYTLNSQIVTAYYGHVDITRVAVKAGDTVKSGQSLGFLGKACSSQTSGERKHLHFALHTGSVIDVRGYVNTLAQLKAWLNPKETLTALHAQEP